jgi:hypothetical protein
LTEPFVEYFGWVGFKLLGCVFDLRIGLSIARFYAFAFFDVEMRSPLSCTWGLATFGLTCLSNFIYSLFALMHDRYRWTSSSWCEYAILFVAMSISEVMAIMTLLLLTVTFTFGALLCASMRDHFAIMTTLMLFFIIRYHNPANLSFILWSEALIRETFRWCRTLPNFFFYITDDLTDSIGSTVNLALMFLVTNVIIHGIRFSIWWDKY